MYTDTFKLLILCQIIYSSSVYSNTYPLTQNIQVEAAHIISHWLIGIIKQEVRCIHCIISSVGSQNRIKGDTRVGNGEVILP